MLSKIDYEKISVSDGVATIKVSGCGLYYDALTLFSQSTDRPGSIHIHHHVHERGQAMYCFMEASERRLFLDLISLDGIGPAAAMRLMSSYEPMKICIDIGDGDAADLAKAKGVGPKTAKKIVEGLSKKYVEYKTKGLEGISPMSSSAIPSFERECLARAEKALVKLGYKCKDVRLILNNFIYERSRSQKYTPRADVSVGAADPYNADVFVMAIVTHGLAKLRHK